MKTIKRTKEMPKDAKFIAIDKDGKIHTYNTEHIKAYDCEWEMLIKAEDCRYNRIKIKPYCKNWRKSLRKITDKPTRKQLKARIKELEKKLKEFQVFFGATSIKDYKKWNGTKK
jgi:5'(3')-deoxyribonucleotidase